MLRDFAHHKLAKVPRFSSDALRMDLVLRRHGGASEDGRFSASARVALPGRDIHATAAHADLYTAIVMLVERLVRRTRERKALRAGASQKRRRSVRGSRTVVARDDSARWTDSSAGPVLAVPSTSTWETASNPRSQIPSETSRGGIGLVEHSSSLNPAHGIELRHMEQLTASSRGREAASGHRGSEKQFPGGTSSMEPDYATAPRDTPGKKNIIDIPTEVPGQSLKHVLLAVDYTKQSEAVARAGAALASKTGASLSFIHVLEPMTHDPELVARWIDFPEQRRHYALARLQTWSRRHLGGVEASHGLVEGLPWEQVVRFSEENEVDLIVMGRSGSRWFGRLTARTVERVVQHSKCPVLIVGHDQQHAPFEPRRMLLPTDFSADSLEAFPWADRIARKYGSQILLANVQDPMGLPGTLAYSYFQPEIDTQRLQADTKLEDWRREHLAADLRVETRVMEGTPARALCRLVDSSRTDLIVMSTHGTKGWVRQWLGGTTEGVLRHVTCSVLVVPTGREAKA